MWRRKSETISPTTTDLRSKHCTGLGWVARKHVVVVAWELPNPLPVKVGARTTRVRPLTLHPRPARIRNPIPERASQPHPIPASLAFPLGDVDGLDGRPTSRLGRPSGLVLFCALSPASLGSSPRFFRSHHRVPEPQPNSLLLWISLTMIKIRRLSGWPGTVGDCFAILQSNSFKMLTYVRL
jgi:hypothetical protein